jgi:hypothetical protein
MSRAIAGMSPPGDMAGFLSSYFMPDFTDAGRFHFIYTDTAPISLRLRSHAGDVAEYWLALVLYRSYRLISIIIGRHL